jgi:hypothetical protein
MVASIAMCVYNDICIYTLFSLLVIGTSNKHWFDQSMNVICFLNAFLFCVHTWGIFEGTVPCVVILPLSRCYYFIFKMSLKIVTGTGTGTGTGNCKIKSRIVKDVIDNLIFLSTSLPVSFFLS